MKYFTIRELCRSQTAERRGIINYPSQEVVANLTFLIEHLLDPIRKRVGKPININSGYRSPELNKAIGGSTTSAHCKGQAADIECFGLDNYQLAKIIYKEFKYDQLILECYKEGDPSSGWVHIAIRKPPAQNRQLTMTYNRKDKYSEYQFS